MDISDEEMILMNSKKENPNPKIEKDLNEFNENWSKVVDQCSKIHKIENSEDQVTLNKIEDEILEIVRLESKPEEPEPEPEPEPVKEPEPVPEPVEERPPSGRGRSADKKGGKGKKVQNHDPEVENQKEVEVVVQNLVIDLALVPQRNLQVQKDRKNHGQEVPRERKRAKKKKNQKNQKLNQEMKNGNGF